jgi:anti-sigma B factor antagonist
MPSTSKFGITKKQMDGIDCFYLEGYLDAHTAPQLESAFQESLDAGKYKLLVNFKDLDYISSAGLGVFMAFIEDIRNQAGDIKLTSMQEKVFSVFDLLGFPMLFDIMPNDTEAIDKFSSTVTDDSNN